MTDFALSLTDIGRTFRNGRVTRAVQGISLDIKPGEFFVFVGLSGSGKSTILRMMSGLDRPTVGKVHLGEGIGPNDINFVFQQFALLPWLTVRENVELGLIGRGVPEHDRRRRAYAELELLGLGKHTESLPRELSGGQRQRVGIARALVTKPKILFMDEPFSELDSVTADQLRLDLLRIWEEQKFTVVLVTHILSEAVQLADRIAVLQANPGHISRIFDNHLSRPRVMRSPEAFALEDQLRSHLVT